MRETDAIVADGAVALEGDTGAARPWESLEPSLLGAGTIALVLLVWELVPHLLTLSPGMELFFTTPTRMPATLWNMFATGEIWQPLRVSATAFARGLAVGIPAGLPLGILLGRSPTLDALFDPFVTALNATPRLVFLPLFLLWFGLGLWSKVLIVFVGALFPILINTYEGVRNADNVLINVGRWSGGGEGTFPRL